MNEHRTTISPSTIARPLWTLALATALLFGGALEASEPEPVPTFSASYSVRYGILRGAMTLELRPDQDGTYVYETALRPRGLVSLFRRGEIREISTLEANGKRIKPVDYVSTDTIARPHRRTNYIFDQVSGQVTGVYKSNPVDVPMRAGGQNRISAHIAVMRALQSGGELTEISIFDRSRWKDYRFEVTRGQTVELSSGRYDTVAVSYTSSKDDKRWLLHCAEALNYLPVLIVLSEDGKTKSRAELVDYRLDTGQAAT